MAYTELSQPIGPATDGTDDEVTVGSVGARATAGTITTAIHKVPARDRDQDGTTGADVSVGHLLNALDYFKADWEAQAQGNLIMNGDFAIAQRGTSFASASGYTLDRWAYVAITTGAVTITQDTDRPAGNQAAYSLKVDCTTADASIGSGDYAYVEQRVEGFLIRPHLSQVMTLSFWVKSTKTGTFGVGVHNSIANGSYVAEYTVSSSDTWEFKTITFTMDDGTTGTWDFTTGIGLRIRWMLAAGSTYQTTAGSWQIGNYGATASQVNALDSTSNNFLLAEVQLIQGPQAAPLMLRRPYPLELALCQRYYEKSYDEGTAPGTATGTGSEVEVTAYATALGHRVTYKTRKRTAPTVTCYSTSTGTSGKVYDVTGTTDVNSSVQNNGETGFQQNAAITDQHAATFQWTADAEL